MSISQHKAWELMYQAWKDSIGDCFLPDAAERGKLVRGCRGKMAFPNFTWAMLTALKMERNRDVKDKCILNIYSCQICGLEHIGNRRHRGNR